MNKCFITKLPSSVDNDNLPVLGQLRINWLKQSDLADNDARAIGLQTNDNITVKVSGAHFTNNTLSSNDGNAKTIKAADGVVWLYVSNDADAVLTIDNKYSLQQMNFVINDKKNLDRQVYFDIEDIKYCNNLNYLNLNPIQVSGNISDLSKLTNLTYLDISETPLIGNLSALSKLTNLTFINLTATQIIGDVDNLASLTKLTFFDGWAMSLTGDMSKLPASMQFISQNLRKISTNFTWTAKGRQNASFLGMDGNIPFDTASMDNMLIDQATCSKTTYWQNKLSVSGTRTSASDAAVEAIQNMGVTITGVTKQA